MSDTLIAIPSRLGGDPAAEQAARRHPRRADDRARLAAGRRGQGVGRVIVATDVMTFAHAIAAAGGEAVMTRADHTNGSDRIHEAITAIDPGKRYTRIVNVQGDLPTIDPRLVQACLAPLETPEVDIATLAAVITRPEERDNPAVVKAIGTPDRAGPACARCTSPARQRPTGDGPLYHHIGMYAYRRAALEHYVTLKPAPLETRERLEQLRALENGHAHRHPDGRHGAARSRYAGRTGTRAGFAGIRLG